MKLSDFEIFNKFYTTMESVFKQFDAVTHSDLNEIKKLQGKLNEVKNYQVSPELYDKIKKVFDVTISTTFGEPVAKYSDYDYYDVFDGFEYKPIVPYTENYVARTEREDFFEISKYKPEAEEMISHLSNLINPKTIGLFKEKIADCDLFISSKIRQAEALENKKYKFWQGKQKEDDRMYASALKQCAIDSEPFKKRLADIIEQIKGTEKNHLGFQARQVCDEYKNSKKEFDSMASERSVIADYLESEIRSIYDRIIERNEYDMDSSKMSPDLKEPFKGKELSVKLKKEIAGLSITPEEIEALKNDKLFILTFYDAVEKKGELQDTEVGRFVSAYLVQVLQNKRKELIDEQKKIQNSTMER